MAESRRFTSQECLVEVEREITMRRRVYGNKVQIGGMTQDEMDRRIGIMAQIAKDLRARLDEESPKLI